MLLPVRIVYNLLQIGKAQKVEVSYLPRATAIPRIRLVSDICCPICILALDIVCLDESYIGQTCTQRALHGLIHPETRYRRASAHQLPRPTLYLRFTR